MNHPDQEVKDFIAEQIVGQIGDPNAVPRCSTVDFVTSIPGGRTSICPDSTAVGAAAVRTSITEGFSPVFNLEPPPGVALKLGFIAVNTPVSIEVTVKGRYPYNVSARLSNTPQSLAVNNSTITLWGNPADPAHDPYRGVCVSNSNQPNPPVSDPGYPELPSYGNCSTNAPSRPFLTLPRACEGPLTTSYATDSWQNPATYLASGEPDLSNPNWASGSALTHDDAIRPIPWA